MIFRNVSLLAMVVAIGLLLFLVHLFKSKDHNPKSGKWGHWGFILLFLVGGALAFLIASRSGIAVPMRGLRLGIPGVLPVLILVFLLLLFMWIFHDKQGRGRRAGILIMFLTVLLLIGAGYYVLTPRHAPSASLPELEISYQNRIADASQTPAIWSDRIEQRYSADIYPSKVSAVRALGHEVAARIPKIRPHIKLVQDEHERILMEELREVIVDVIDDCRCEIVTQSGEVDPEQEEIGVALEIDALEGSKSLKPVIIKKTKNFTSVTEGAYILETPGDVGKISARIFSANYDRRGIEVRFAEKPWVENFAEFLNRPDQPQPQWIQARSSKTCFSAEEAHQLSLQDAAQRVGDFLKGLQTTGAKVLPEDLLACGMIVDQFSQSFNGSEGKVWRQALLLDVSKPKIERLLVQKNAALAMQRRNVAFLGASFLGMIGIICVLYALANAATKGYYSTVLRVFTVVLVIAAVTGLVLALKIR